MASILVNIAVGLVDILLIYKIFKMSKLFVKAAEVDVDQTHDKREECDSFIETGIPPPLEDAPFYLQQALDMPVLSSYTGTKGWKWTPEFVQSSGGLGTWSITRWAYAGPVVCPTLGGSADGKNGMVRGQQCVFYGTVPPQ